MGDVPNCDGSIRPMNSSSVGMLAPFLCSRYADSAWPPRVRISFQLRSFFSFSSGLAIEPTVIVSSFALAHYQAQFMIAKSIRVALFTFCRGDRDVEHLACRREVDRILTRPFSGLHEMIKKCLCI